MQKSFVHSKYSAASKYSASTQQVLSCQGHGYPDGCVKAVMGILRVAAEREVATHSSILAWEIPWTEEPGMLQSVGLQRIGHNCLPNTHTHTRVAAQLVVAMVVVITTGSNSSGSVNGSSDSSTVEWPYC